MNVRLWYALSPLVLSSFCSESRGALAPIELPDSPILRTVDKFGFINIGKIFVFAQNVIIELHGTKNIEQIDHLTKVYKISLPIPLNKGNKKPNRFAIVLYGDEYLTVQELAELETSGKGDPVLMKKALAHAIDNFEKFSEDYIEEIQMAKGYMVKLIDHWCIARNRPNSILRDWGSIDHSERESMHTTMSSFKIFESLQDDLLTFLKDLVRSCPISHKAYRDSLKHS